MGLETATYIDALVTSNPDGNDQASTADDHIRLIKAALKRTFPLIAGAVSASHQALSFTNDLSASVQAQFNALRDGSATARAALFARSASFAILATRAESASFATFAGLAQSASFAVRANRAESASFATLASFAQSAGFAATAGSANFAASAAIAGATNANAVTNAMLADMANSTIKGRAAGAGTGDPQDLTAAQLIDILETADGSGSGLDADTVDGQHASAFAAASHTHDASAITSGTFANARIAQSNVTQHQGALTIAESQITDGAILARVSANETIGGTWTFNATPRRGGAGGFLYFADANLVASEIIVSSTDPGVGSPGRIWLQY